MNDSPSSVRILIIDDSPDDRFLFVRMIRKSMELECEITEVNDGIEGIRTTTSGEDWDCVFLDHGLPGTSGIDVLRMIRNIPSGELIPIVMITGLGDEELAVEAMKAGAHDYLVKGNLKEASIRRVINSVLAKRKMDFRLIEEAAMRAAVEEELKQSQLRAAELEGIHKTVATLAHEINNPLTGIIAYLQMASEPGRRTDENIEIMAEALGAAKRIRDVVAKIQNIREPTYRPYIGDREIIDIRDESENSKE